MRNATRWGRDGRERRDGRAAHRRASPVIAQDKMAMVTDAPGLYEGAGRRREGHLGLCQGPGRQGAALKAIDDLMARAPKIDDQFPAGTSVTDFPGKTAAKPEIWTDWDKVKMIPVALQAEEVKLKAAIQSGDTKAVADQIGATGKAGCGACHGPYRVKTS